MLYKIIYYKLFFIYKKYILWSNISSLIYKFNDLYLLKKRKNTLYETKKTLIPE